MRGCLAVLTAATAVASASPAGAQPVTRPTQVPCRVRIVDAPADARTEIESWVRAEPRCERELEVKVVSTDDGLYLSARDGDGRVRERIVPDAQAAAVLVVSWMADDSLPPETPSPVERAVPAASATAAGATAPRNDDELPDGLSAAGSGSYVPRRFGRWLGIGATATGHGHLGVRGELELFQTHHLSLGIAAGWRQADERANGDGDNGGDRDAGVGELRFLVGMEHSFGRLTLGAHLGIGADIATGDQHRSDMQMTGDIMPLAPLDPLAPTAGDHDGSSPRVVPAAELGLIGRLRITDTWGLLGGPLLETTAARPEPQLSVFVGVTRRL